MQTHIDIQTFKQLQQSSSKLDAFFSFNAAETLNISCNYTYGNKILFVQHSNRGFVTLLQCLVGRKNCQSLYPLLII
jgi:hypothetical protein